MKGINEYIFTFGCGHPLAKYYLPIQEKSEEEARKLVMKTMGVHWAFCYESKEQAGVDKYSLTRIEVPKALKYN